MEMLHKHPESGDILNLQDAKVFSGKKKNYYIQHKATLLDERFRYGKFQANLWRKLESCVQVSKNRFLNAILFYILGRIYIRANLW